MINRWALACLCAAVAACSGASEPARDPWAAPGPCPAAGGEIELTGPAYLDAGGHTDVTSVAFGRLKGEPIAISAGEEGTVRFWSLPGLQPVAEPLEGTAATAVDLGGGRTGVVTEGTYGGRLWDLTSRRVLMRFPKETAYAVGTFRGIEALFVSHGSTVRVVDPRTRALLETLPIPGADMMAVGQLDGRPVLVSGGGSYSQAELDLWDLTSRRRIDRDLFLDDWEEEDAHPDGLVIRQIAGKPLLWASHGETRVDRWDLSREQDPKTVLRVEGDARREGGSYRSIAVTDVDGRLTLAAGGSRRDEHRSSPNSIDLFDATTGERLGPLRGHDGEITALAAGRLDGRPVLLSGSGDNTVRLWDLSSRRQIGGPTPGGPVDGVQFAAVAQVGGEPVVVTGEERGVVRTWDASTGRLTGAPMMGRSPQADQVGLTSLVTADLGGVPVAVAGEQGGIRIWDLRTSTEVGRLPLRHAQSVDRLVLVQRDGQPLVTASSGNVLYTWDLRTRRLIDTFDPRAKESASALSLIDGRAVFAAWDPGQRPGKVRIWDVAGRRRLSSFTVVSPEEDVPPGMDFSIAGLGLFGCAPAVFASGQKIVRVLDARTGRDLAPPLRVEPRDEAFSSRLHDGTVTTVHGRSVVLVSFSPDEDSQLWDLTAREPLSPRIRGVKDHALATGAHVVVTNGPGERVHLWRLTP
ncbi:hypothetical protein GCM10010149_13670 [Nonomuraea roseoviolacea subsp. roseoviolacea]